MNGSKGCGCSAIGASGWLALLVVLLVVPAVLAIAAAAALLFFGTLGAASAGTVVPVLLVIAIVLLGLILLLLLLMLWCCCRGKADLAGLARLLKLLPNLREAGAALETTAAALGGLAQTLRAAKIPVVAAGGAAHDAGEKIDVSIPTVSARKKNLAGFGDVVVALDAGTVSPLHDASQRLYAVGDELNGPDGLATELGRGADRCDQAAAGLRALKAVFDAF